MTQEEFDEIMAHLESFGISLNTQKKRLQMALQVSLPNELVNIERKISEATSTTHGPANRSAYALQALYRSINSPIERRKEVDNVKIAMGYIEQFVKLMKDNETISALQQRITTGKLE